MWSSASEFFAMGGYAFYVWSSYLVVFLFVFLEVILLRARRRSLLKRITRMIRMNQEETRE